MRHEQKATILQFCCLKEWKNSERLQASKVKVFIMWLYVRVLRSAKKQIRRVGESKDELKVWECF